MALLYYFYSSILLLKAEVKGVFGPCSSCGDSLLKRLDIDIAVLDNGSFALEADFTGFVGAFGTDVLQYAVDQNHDPVVLADDIVGVPLTQWFFAAVFELDGSAPFNSRAPFCVLGTYSRSL